MNTETVVYQFRPDGDPAVYDYFPVKVGELACYCGSVYEQNPQRFDQIAEYRFQGQTQEAIECLVCNTIYFTDKLNSLLTDKTLDLMNTVGVGVSGVVTIEGNRIILASAASVPWSTLEALAARANWQVRGVESSWLSEPELLVAVLQGRLLLIWLCHDRRGYDFLVGQL